MKLVGEVDDESRDYVENFEIKVSLGQMEMRHARSAVYNFFHARGKEVFSGEISEGQMISEDGFLSIVKFHGRARSKDRKDLVLFLHELGSHLSEELGQEFLELYAYGRHWLK